MGLILMPLFKPMVRLFHPPAEIVDDIFIVILINTMDQIPLWSIAFITLSALRAAGDSKFTSLTSMLSMWLCRVVLPIACTAPFRLLRFHVNFSCSAYII
ncbi:UNVERIFIED_CONTAM: Na+-driven multidrug efflux pump [Paenibacillus sp. PvR008]